jgi:GNAT superfamily N-acetyltransferase
MQPLIAEWDAAHPRRPELRAFVEAQGQTRWVNFAAAWHRSSHLLVAAQDGAIAGFLRYTVQEIGPDAGCPPVLLGDVPLLEAKVLAFAVDAAHQRQGIGRALQVALIAAARRQDCYQVRSHSGGDHPANHQLKLGLGFAIHPIVRGDDDKGAYFIMPLTGISF